MEKEIKLLKRRSEERTKTMDEIDKENEFLLKNIETLMMLIKQEDYLTQVLEDKTQELQSHFTKMQPYMILCNKTFSQINSCMNLYLNN